MEAGILTFSRAHNYGAILQCYALYETLKTQGYNVKVIEYRQQFLEANNRPFLFQVLMKRTGNPRAFLRYLKQYGKRLKYERMFDKFKSAYLDCTEACSGDDIPDYFDLYIVGSDQVWSTDCTAGIDKIYLGFFKRKRTSVLAGYAISSNTESIERIGTDLIRKSIENFDTLSFRESGIAEQVYAMTGYKTDVLLDPVLLADKHIWDKMTEKKYSGGKYVLVYEVRTNKTDRNYLMRMAQEYARNKHCEIMTPNNVSPSEFVSLFRYAQYIITSSFHGTAFGLIFNKPMSVYCLDDGQDGRYIELLQRVGARHVLQHIGEPLKTVGIDYEKVNAKLKILQQASMDYLTGLRSMINDKHNDINCRSGI